MIIIKDTSNYLFSFATLVDFSRKLFSSDAKEKIFHVNLWGLFPFFFSYHPPPIITRGIEMLISSDVDYLLNAMRRPERKGKYIHVIISALVNIIFFFLIMLGDRNI